MGQNFDSNDNFLQKYVYFTHAKKKFCGEGIAFVDWPK